MDRARNSVRNIIFGLTGQLLNIVASFAARTVLINLMGQSYNGINSLFTNILMVFSLADLGVGTAIIFSLYKPIAEGNTVKIKALMNLFAKAYNIIGFAIIGLGLIMTPFLHVFISGDPGVENLYIIFLLYVVNTASTYFLSYKGVLITAHQKNYIVTNVVYISSVVSYILQIIALYMTRNYILMLSLQVATNILQNVITWRIANRMFPYLKGKNNERLTKAERSGIFRNMGSTMFYRVGQVIINGTDSILVSSFFGTVLTGIYGNYLLILTTVKNLLLMFFKAITASVGNLNAMESTEHKYEIYNMVYFGNFWLFGFCSVCFYVLFNPFVTLWLGENNLLSVSTVILLVLNFYIMGMRNVTTTFRETMGIFKEGRMVPIIASIVNIAASIILVKLIGLDGVFIGTTISLVGVMVWLEPVILFKHGFKRSAAPYFLKYIMYLIVVAAGAWLTGFFCDTLMPNVTWLTFIGRLGACIVIPNALFAIIFFKTRDFRLLLGSVRSVISRKLRRKAA